MGRISDKWHKFIKNSIIHDTIKREWAKKSLGATLLIVGFTAFPTILGFLIAALRTKHTAFLDSCYIEGQFLLYTISLIASAYTILHFHKKTVSGWWIFILVLFGGVYATNDLLSSLQEQTNLNFLFWLSVVGLIIGAITCFYAQYTQQKHSPPDVTKKMRHEIGTIVDNLEV